MLPAQGNLAAHDQISRNKDMILGLDWYNPVRNVLVLHSCNILAIGDPFLVPFHPALDRIPGTHRTQTPWLDPDFASQSAFSRPVSGPSTFNSYDNLFLRDLLIYKSCKRVAGGSSCILAIDDSYTCYAFLLPDRLHTRAGRSCSSLSVPLVAMVSAPL